MVIWNSDCERVEIFAENDEGLDSYELPEHELIQLEAMGNEA